MEPEASRTRVVVPPPLQDPPALSWARRRAFVRSCGGFLFAATAETLLPAFAFAIRPDLGLTSSQQGLAVGFSTAGLALGNLVSGALGARVSARCGLAVVFAVLSAGSLFVSRVESMGDLAVGMTILGVGAGAYFPIGLSWTGRISEGPRRATTMGVWATAFPLGLAVSSQLANLVDGDWRLGFRAFAIASLIWALVQLLPTASERPVATAESERNGEATWDLVLIGIAAAFGYYGIVLYLPTFLIENGWTVASVAGLVTVTRLAAFPVKMLAGILADRYGQVEVALACVGASFLTVGVVVSGSPLGEAVGAAAYMLINGALFPIVYALLTDVVTGKQQVLAAGIGRAGVLGLGWVAAVFIGFAAAVTSPSIAIGVTALPALVVVIVGTVRTRRTTEPALVHPGP